jgi:hypothetical protein
MWYWNQSEYQHFLYRNLQAYSKIGMEIQKTLKSPNSSRGGGEEKNGSRKAVQTWRSLIMKYSAQGSVVTVYRQNIVQWNGEVNKKIDSHVYGQFDFLQSCQGNSMEKGESFQQM